MKEKNSVDDNNQEENLEKNKGIIPTIIEDELSKSYLDYAMSVIVGRALPDFRDGLKPVHRRILFSMHQLGLKYNSAFKKCARIVGDCLGKYHPHGDQSVYDALVRMAQDFSLRYPLIKGQGNFGSIDGDGPAAMRYTEAKLAKITDEMLQDIEKETVDFTENFDGSLKEPIVLPAKLPNLLINGSSGIAVGMATSIPPHNLKEITDAIIALIDNPDLEAADLMEFIKGPDFPTGAIIVGRGGIIEAYKRGKGRIKVRSLVEIEKKNNKTALIIKEIPYQITKSSLIEQIANVVKEKIIEGISDLRDESDRKGIRVVIELKKDINPEIILNQLYKHTKLQTTFSIILLGLDNNQPKVLGLKEIIELYIKHRIEVVTRRTKYDLKKAEERVHILEGLKIALDNIDEAVALIKSVNNTKEAIKKLIERFNLSEIQAKSILDMKLQKLTSLEQEKLITEYNNLKEKIVLYKKILSDKNEILQIIKDELVELKEKYGDERRTKIIDDEEEIDYEDLITPEEEVITISNQGYIKRTPLDIYRAQKRGGVGVKGATTKEEDFIEHLFIANTHDYLLIFTNKGRVYWKKVYYLPEGSRNSKGKPIINLIKIDKDEKINSIIPISNFKKDKKEYLFFVTKKGIVKKTLLEFYSKPRKGGINAITLKNDSLVSVLKVKDEDNIVIASYKGQAIRFKSKDVRGMGRNAYGVIGIRLRKDDEVIGAVVDNNHSLLTVTEKGYGKRTLFKEYRLINRGGVGVRNILVTEKTGGVIAIKSVTDSEELMIGTKKGILIRIKVSSIRIIGRNTQGVRLINLKEDDKVVACAKIINNE